MRQLKITKSITNRESASLDKYLQEIGREDLITVEEEVELAQRIRKGDRVALEKLTRANLRFVVSVAKQYQNQGLSLPDLINEGNLGLIKAAEKFDETRGFKFISYAVWWIRQSILQALAEQSRIVRLPLNQVGSLNKISKAFSKFEQENERRPSPEELADELEIPVDKISDTLKVSGRHISVDAPFVEGEDNSLLDVLVNDDSPMADRSLVNESLAEKEIDKKTKMYKQVKKNGSIVEFPRQNETTLSRWIEGRIRRNGKNITRDAYALFIRKTGDDMENIDKELEKLLCYTLEKDYIDISDVEAITTEQTENKIFDMIDAVALHQQKKALDLYYDLLALKEAPMRILFLLSSQFQRLMIVKSMTNQGFGNKEIALKAGCPEWSVRKYQSQSRAFSMDQLKQAIRDGVEYETAVKTGHMNDQMAVELFLVQYSAGK